MSDMTQEGYHAGNLIRMLCLSAQHIGRPFSVYPLRLTARYFPHLILPNESSPTPRRR